MDEQPPPRRIAAPRLGPATIESPLEAAFGPDDDSYRFVPDGACVRENAEVDASLPPAEGFLFEKAGPRAKLYFDPARSRAAIVSCGGLCPGLNAVIRSLFLELHHNYGVPEVLGIRYGYSGLNRDTGRPPLTLTTELVADIHHEGGTILATSRGEQSVPSMVETLDAWGVNMLFCLGGDGTLRGAHAIAQEVGKRELKISVIGIPKTIDNDVRFCDRTFGFVTAVDRATDALYCAHVEATGAFRGIGLVKVMGRDSGFIAAVAALASQDVNFVLVPEVPFELHGEHGLLAALDKRLDARQHAVIVVAEGAGQNLFAEARKDRDASGNLKFHDIGPHLKQTISDHFNTVGKPVNIKYLDPSYLIRGAPPNTEDRLLCDQLARQAAHAALSGRTDLVVCTKSGRFMHVPIAMAVASKNQIDPRGELWTAVLSATGQPACFRRAD